MEKDYREFLVFVVEDCWCIVWDDGLTMQFQTPKLHLIILTTTLPKPHNPQLHPPHPPMLQYKQILAHIPKTQIINIIILNNIRHNTKSHINNKFIHIKYAYNGIRYKTALTEIKDGWLSYYVYINYDETYTFESNYAEGKIVCC